MCVNTDWKSHTGSYYVGFCVSLNLGGYSFKPNGKAWKGIPSMWAGTQMFGMCFPSAERIRVVWL